MAESFDIVIVGGGITGSALGFVMARSGLNIKILERDQIYHDRVRGEFMVSWGVVELNRLGLLETLVNAGGIFVDRHVPYDENMTPAVAEANSFAMSSLAPGLPSPLCMGHPAMCETLNQAAKAAGVSVSRGVKSVKVRAGEKPEVSYRLGAEEMTLKAKLIIGADGRNSVVRRQIGVDLQKDPPHNLLGGMLVEGETNWPSDSFTFGTEGNIHFLIFPQPEDRLRLYLCYDFADRERFTGPDKERNLLQAFRLSCLPQGEQIARCRPISPFHSYSNEDHWSDHPIAPGVVLIGDAAGHCDPITGQGLSIGLRDVRVVSDILLEGDWTQAAFAPYVEERRERMRRLRVAAKYTAILKAEFGEDARRRRQRANNRSMNEGYPSPTYSGMLGPDVLPAECFAQSSIDALLAP